MTSIGIQSLRRWLRARIDTPTPCYLLLLIIVSCFLAPASGRKLNFFKLPISAASTATRAACAQEGNCNGECFAGSSELHTPSGEKLLRDVNIGDLVLTMDKSGVLTYSPVIGFSSRRHSYQSVFLRIVTDTGHAILVTKGHYMFVMSHKSGLSLNVHTWPYVQANDIKVGDFLPVVQSNQTIFGRVTMIENQSHFGVYMPHTVSGAILVNGILATELTSIIPQALASSRLHGFLVKMFSAMNNIGYKRIASDLSYWIHGTSDAVMYFPENQELAYS